MRLLIGFLCLLITLGAHAGSKVVVTDTKPVYLDSHTGSTWRSEVNSAIEAFHKGDLASAKSKLKPALAFCDALARPNLTLVSVVTRAEYERYLRERSDDNPVEWVDHACPSAYKTAAFMLIEEKGAPEDVLKYLDQAIAIAPYWSDPLAEKGFLLNQTGRPREALVAYQHAIELQNTFDNAANQDKAIAWRGLGYTYVELGELDKAQHAYEESLRIDPGNAIATDELEYIRKQRGSK
jgi:tetratricopeptide (TPR) repeat protein